MGTPMSRAAAAAVAAPTSLLRAAVGGITIQTPDDGATRTDVHSATTGTGGAQTLPVNASGRTVRVHGTRRDSGQLRMTPSGRAGRLH